EKGSATQGVGEEIVIRASVPEAVPEGEEPRMQMTREKLDRIVAEAVGRALVARDAAMKEKHTTMIERPGVEAERSAEVVERPIVAVERPIVRVEQHVPGIPRPLRGGSHCRDDQEESSVISPVVPRQSRDALMEQMANQIKELQARVEGMRHLRMQGHPFTNDVLGADLPHSFREPSIYYDGSSDPARHLRSFENVAVLHRYNDGVCCRAFLTTLKGPAHDWFHQLPAGSVHSFDAFSSLFINQFSSARKHEKTYMSLMNMQQWENESLREYVT
ncbi:Unknown protein, partial [Striga hermonthica]